MRSDTRFLLTGGLLLLAACTRTVILQPAPERQQRGSRPPPRTEPDRPPPDYNQPPARTHEVLIPPGHLPNPGECRVWIPGTPPGRQPRPRSRPCMGIEAVAPAGSWIVYRRADDRRLLYLRIIDERRPGIVIRNRIFDVDSWELIREENVQEEQRGNDRQQQERPREQPANPPPVVQPPIGYRPPDPKPPPPEVRPPAERPPLPPQEVIRPVQPPPGQQPPPTQPPPAQPPPVQPPVQPPAVQPPPVQPPVQPPPAQPPPPQPTGTLTLDVPPGHLPDLGQCRVWIPGVPPGRQAKPKSRSCDGITGVAPAGSWILYRPAGDQKVVHVRVVDERRGGVVIRVRIFDIDSKRLVREENP